MAKLFKTSIARKVAMALSGIFLVIFLVIHFAVNLTSVFSENLFNELSHFMGTNPLIQFAMQPILLLGVIFHFVMGFVLEIQNRKARGANAYVQYNGGANSTWMSRNMIYSGGVVLMFLILHLKHFWIHEMNVKYVQGDMTGLGIDGGFRYYADLIATLSNPITVAVYVLSFIFLCLHLLHGFKSSMQSVGILTIRQKTLVSIGKWYSYIICGGFIFIALFHFFSNFSHS
ncbi:succinate dehydrogenase cytochrome b subunit [Capnocytophaga catalasegens]|uniref:Succinate dehydrogenase n=1 Tax=Capnocytophaga catalasegens TaxID=1004260 RepID=A0AAV5AXK1_9FLAO|nr:succinate dehydrogenase cytochrome b subunit [Capnocytophaga catalasegens]GIZ15708.1 succinate dehydrogenase [Capnocytophaga catalasegens]GJM50095.1 succinate dehydrogenase [Capnocytophaga catalasegens]GJM53080.1 succinate dehydrogenase [Capnocytophaga catalasegens]